MHTLKTTPQGPTLLLRNGKQLNCPYQSQMIADAHGPRGFISNPCNDSCPLFDIQNDGKRVKLHCGNTAEYITQIETTQTQQNSNIINLNGK